MFTQMQLNTNIISKVKYNYKNIEISFNSHYAQSLFISSSYTVNYLLGILLTTKHSYMVKLSIMQ